MKTRTLALLTGALAALSMAAVAMAQSTDDKAQAGQKTAAPQDTRTEAEKRAARRAANEARLKAAGQDGKADPTPAAEEEEEQAGHKR